MKRKVKVRCYDGVIELNVILLYFNSVTLTTTAVYRKEEIL